MGDTQTLQDIARALRMHSLQMTAASKSGHPTTCMSMAEIMSVLFFDEMAFNKADPKDPANDEIILSKGHAAPILWAAYAEAGIVPREELLNLRKIDSHLEGHPTPRMEWIKAATGSLGQGLSVGVGMAMAQVKKGSKARTYVVLGDGELAEGSVWEAASLAAHNNVTNLCAIGDINALGQSGGTLHNHEMDGWKKKFESFGWHAIVVNGHEVEELKTALSQARQNQDKPTVILAKTFKGRGVSFLEGKPGFHGKPIMGEDLEKALAELGEEPQLNVAGLVKQPQPLAVSVQSPQSPGDPTYERGQMVATRQAYGNALARLGETNPNVLVLDAETSNSTFAQTFAKAHPDRYVECFIAEQNMVGMGVGFGAKGFVPFASTFAAFHTRGHDFIRMAAVSESNLKIVGSHAGCSIGADGGSQMGLEDLGMMRALPDCAVLYPSDAVSAEKLTEELAKYPHMGYLRTTREKTPVLYDNTDQFSIGGSRVVQQNEGDVITILAAGITLHESIKAAAKLQEENIGVSIVDLYSVKPLDTQTILDVAAKTNNRILVVEDHYPEGGMAEAVALAISGKLTISHLCVRSLPRSGEPAELLALHKIDANAIVAEVKGQLAEMQEA